MSSRRAGLAAVVVLAGVVFGVIPAGCGSDDKRDLFVKGSSDAALEAEAEAAAPDAEANVDPTVGGPCTEDAQCDDQIACTYDRCDPAIGRCRNLPDDSQCDDTFYCNGKEVCLLRQGCIAGPVVTCQDDNVCTIDHCVESTKSCVHDPRDVDGDGDPDDHCVGAADCDDHDPTISSKHSEVCGNFKDDNCDGQIDEQPCSAPSYDTCATAFDVTDSGSFMISTVAAAVDYTSVCAVRTPAAAHDVVIALTNTGSDPVNIEVKATSEKSGDDLAISMQSACGVQASELECANFTFTGAASAVARSVGSGLTVYAIVTTQNESTVDLRVTYGPGAARPANESCTAPQPVALGTAFDVPIVNPLRNLNTDCDALTGELTYEFTLAADSDVRIFGSVLDGPGVPVISLRDVGCSSEYRCHEGDGTALFARNLAAGPHVVAVSGTAQLDASVTVRAYPPTTAPPNQTCATAPVINPNASVVVDLSAQEAAIKNGCLQGQTSAAYDLTIFEASDVLLVGTFSAGDSGSVSLNAPACTPGDLIGCGQGDIPSRVSRRNLSAGAYRAGIGDEAAETVRLDVFVRPTVPPTAVDAADNCNDVFTIPPGGGYFTGDTSVHNADFGTSCDAPGLPLGGAKDQILRFDITAPQRVILDMTGSTFTTMLDLRQGATCPGTELPDSCFLGGGPGRSYVDVELGPGTYWLQIDGYAGEDGMWNLDVRVLPP